MSSVPDEVPISDARDHFADVLGRARYAGQITYITKRGQRVGAVVPVEVAEAAESAEDAYLSGLARDAEAELAAGATTRPLGEVIAELELGTSDPDEVALASDDLSFPGQRRSPEGQRQRAPRVRMRPAPPDTNAGTTDDADAHPRR